MNDPAPTVLPWGGELGQVQWRDCQASAKTRKVKITLQFESGNPAPYWREIAEFVVAAFDPREEIAKFKVPAITADGTHVLVGPGDREKIAQAYIEAEKQRNLDCCCGETSSPCNACNEFEFSLADSIFAALGVKQ